MNDSTQQPKLDAEALKYALEWFKYHADQRYKAVFIYAINFLLPLVSASIAFYSLQGKGGITPYALIPLLVGALYGIATTFIFYFLDRRNEELVKLGEEALRSHETLMRSDSWILKKEEMKSITRKTVWRSHRFLFNMLFLLGFSVFLMTLSASSYVLWKVVQSPSSNSEPTK